MFRSLIFMLTTLVLFSCGSRSELSFESPDKTKQINLQGSKSSSLDPWIINLTAKSTTATKTFKLEFFQSEWNKENVQIKWISPSQAILQLKGQDNFANHFLIVFDGKEITLRDQ